MAAKPTPGGSDGTYGTELNEFLDVSLASDGKVKDGAVFSTSAAPSVDAGVANKKYVDDQITAQVPLLARVKAWVQFNSAGTIQGTGYNITSVTKSSTGTYDILWDTDFADDDYVVVATAITNSRNLTVTSIATTGCTIKSYTTQTTQLVDGGMHVMAIGAQ